MKKTISILLTLCMIVALMPAAMAAKKATFKDVPENSWCYDYVDYVAEKGYFKGTTETTFEPNAPMTRQQFVVVLSRLANVKVNNNQSPFSDVPAGSYSAGAIAWAAKNGITQGYEDGTFRPTEPITRQQLAAFMNRFMTYYAKNNSMRFIVQGTKINFKDSADIASYAKDAVPYCVKFGLIKGYEDGTFRPAANATRAHVAAIIERLDQVTRKNVGGSGGAPITYCTVTFQNATVGGNTSVSVAANTTYTVPAPDAKAGYDFVKWTDGTNDYAVGNTFTVTGNVTLTAEWAVQIVPDDLLKTAFTSAVKYINDEVYSRYEDAQGVVQIDSIVLDPVTTDFSNTTREIYVNGSAELMDDTLQNLVKRAVDYAVALVQSADPAADVKADYDTIKATVIDVVEALGLQWTGKDIEALAQQVYEQGADAAADIWDMFQANGEYIFETADVIVSGNTVFSINAASKSTSLGAKASAKALAVAIAKELYADLKTETVADNVVELTTAVTMKFNNVPAVAQSYPTEYTMIATMTFTSDVVSYYYANDAHHFVLTISQDWQDAYDEAMEDIAAEALVTVEQVLEQKINDLMGGYLTGNATLDSLVDQLVRFGVYNTAAEAKAAIEDVAEDAATAWMAENLSTNATPSGAAYYLPYDFFWLQNGQIEIVGSDYVLSVDGTVTARKLFNNAVLVDTIEAWADDVLANLDIQAVMNDTMSDVLDPATKAAYQSLVISEAVTQLSSGTATYLVNYLIDGTVNGTGRNLFKEMFLFDDVAALSAASAADAIAGFDNALSYNCAQGSAEHLVKSVLVTIVDDKVDDVFADVMASMSDPLVTDLINSDASIQTYVKALAMVEMGFAATYGDDVTAASSAALAAIGTFLNNYVETKINSVISASIISEMIDAQIVSILGTYSDYLQYLPYLQTVNTFDELAAADVSGLADALASNELQALIAKADISSATMTKALNGLAKVIEKLPADAAVTINGVEFSEAELAAVKAAALSGDIADVCDEIAAMIYALGAISLDNFNVPVVVTYGTYSADCVLHIVIA